MKLFESTIHEYNDLLDSNSPTPGGGSVAGLTGSLACCLARMYGHFSIGKKRYREAEEIRQRDFDECFEKLEAVRKELEKAIDEDALVYGQVSKAYGLDKDDPNREAEIQKALIIASDTPLKVVTNAYKGLELTEKMIEIGNRTVISDLICAMELFACAINCALLNVYVNYNLMTDLEKKDYYQKQYEYYSNNSNELKNNLVSKAKERL